MPRAKEEHKPLLRTAGAMVVRREVREVGIKTVAILQLAVLQSTSWMPGRISHTPMLPIMELRRSIVGQRRFY